MTDAAGDGDRTRRGLHAPTTMAMTPGSTPDARPAWRRRWPVVLAGAAWVLAVVDLVATFRLDALLRQAGRPDLTSLAATSIPVIVASVSAVTVGAVVAARRPRHPVGWLLLVLGLSLTIHDVAYAYTRYGLVARPGALPGAGYLAGLVAGVFLTWLSCAGFVLLLTPTGRLPSRRWRWWARVAAAAPVVWLLAGIVDPAPLYPEYPDIRNPLTIPVGVNVLRGAGAAAALVILVGLVVAAVSLVLRFRRARGLEHQQLRWLVWAAVLVSLAMLVTLAALALDSDFDVFSVALGVSAALLPLATGAAILRYRLYDLDRIISRTLTYGLLTVLLGLGYAGVVLGLGQVLGRDSSLVVAGATLAVAAAFQPARRRLQQLVDRRFNRRRYDAARTIEAFSTRLRDQVDLSTLTGELLAVAEDTMQPTTASLWLRPARSSPPGTTLG